MHVRLKAATKFEWLADDTTGLPLAAVATFGGVPYVLICPLCGCIHELRGQPFDQIGQEATVKPRCLLREFAGQPRSIGQRTPWQTIYEGWLSKHPKAAGHSAIRAVFVGAGADLRGGYMQPAAKRQREAA